MKKNGREWRNLPFSGQNLQVVPVLKSSTGTHYAKEKLYRYTQSGTGTHWQCGTGIDTNQSGTGTTASYNPIFAYFFTVKSHSHTPIV